MSILLLKSAPRIFTRKVLQRYELLIASNIQKEFTMPKIKKLPPTEEIEEEIVEDLDDVQQVIEHVADLCAP